MLTFPTRKKKYIDIQVDFVDMQQDYNGMQLIYVNICNITWHTTMMNFLLTPICCMST